MSVVMRWVAQFECGDEVLRHKLQCMTSVTSANINQVHQLIEEDSHLGIQTVSTLLSISYGSAHLILHDHLNMKKVYACWIPRQLSNEQKRQRVTSAQETICIFDKVGWHRLLDIVTGDDKWFNFL